jgi:hypothetical protein
VVVDGVIAESNDVETFENALVKLLPVKVIALIATIEIKAAIRPYSMAVAPDSSFQIFLIVVNMAVLLKYYFNLIKLTVIIKH